MKKQLNLKEPIKVRTKKLVNGCQSIYLDIYMNGRRQYEFLKLYIIPEHNQADKKRNVETLNLANAIKAQKILEIYNQTYGFNHNRLSNMKLTGYMKLIAEQSVNNRVRKSAIHAVVCHLERYTPNGILLRKVDKTYLLGFIDYLKKTKQEHCKKEKTLHVNTQFYYLKTLRYCLNRAVSEDYITVNPMNKIKNAAHSAIVLVFRHFLMLEFLYLIFFNHFLCSYNTKYAAKIDTFLIIPKIFI